MEFSSMKLLITSFKKQYLYGDCHLEEDGHYFPLIGARIRVQILGLLWLTYKQVTYVPFNEERIKVTDLHI